MHAQHAQQPDAAKAQLTVQKYYIRIIIFIPIYAACSFFSLCFPGASVYVVTLRDLYAFTFSKLTLLCSTAVNGGSLLAQAKLDKLDAWHKAAQLQRPSLLPSG